MQKKPERIQMNDTKKILTLLQAAMFPLIVFVMQFFGIWLSITLLVLLIPIIIYVKRLRISAILLIITLCGYLVWLYTSILIEKIIISNNLSAELGVILSRFGLLGYLTLFAIWHVLDTSSTNNFNLGNLRTSIRLPFIWYGKKDTVLQLTAVFSSLCLILAGLFVFQNKIPFTLLAFGVAFAFINAILEELLWRGLILNRTNDLYGEKIGLLAMSLAFGLYHYSLGFPISTCLVFSLGGIYFGGATLRSKGLISPIIMHISMNLLFVAVGIIF